MPERTSQIDEIFWSALQIESSNDRSAYLDEACGNDSDLRELVDKLLAAQPKAQRFLESAFGLDSPTVDQPLTEQPGDMIGRYKLLEQIGEGGFGVVFMAEQEEPVRRKVALKVIKPGMDTKEVIARFEAERQALAIMDHPNIARVLDAGATESGRPYFVMELVRGVPITEYCDQNNLPARDRLELFHAVCQAVQHAHQKGIIHRDIKPSNVLVTLHDDKPVPKVIDFGVAKATNARLTEKTLFTRFAQMVGTPLYMSPEQAQMSGLDVDTRSDIYSLGVLLYELLTGTTPFDQQRIREAAYDELLRIIREEEPPRPSTRVSTLGEAATTSSAHRRTDPKRLSQSLRGELDWIVMKALEKDRTRRYETASAFAADVQHYLNDEAVVACPPSATYRFRKFARRQKSALLTASLVAMIVLLLAGSVGWIVRDREARQARVSAQVELILGDTERLIQDEEWAEALTTLERAEALLAGSDADLDTRAHVQQLLDDLRLVRRLEEVRMLGSTWTNNGFNHSGADREYAALFRAQGIDVDNHSSEDVAAMLRSHTQIVVPLSVALDDWVNNKQRAGSNEAGWKRLVAVAQLLDPDPQRNRLRSLWGELITAETNSELTDLAHSGQLDQQPVNTLVLLSYTLANAQMSSEAISVLRRAQQIHPADFDANFDLASLLGEHDHEDAIHFYSIALGLRPENAVVWNNLGSVLRRQGRLDDAIRYYEKAIAIDSNFAIAHNNLGVTLSHLWRPNEAIDEYRTAIELDPMHAEAHYNLGNELRRQQKLDAAIDEFRTAIEIEPMYVNAHLNVGVTLGQQHQLDEAIKEFHTAMDLDPESNAAHCNLGFALRKQGKQNEAIDEFRIAIALNPQNVHAHVGLGLALQDLKMLNEAVAEFRTAIAAGDTPGNGVSWEDGALRQEDLDEVTALARLKLIQSLRDQGHSDEALPYLERAQELGVTGRSFWIEYALCHRALTHDSEYEHGCREVVASYPPPDKRTVADWGHLSQNLYRLGKYRETREGLEKTIELRGDAGPSLRSGPRWWYYTLVLCRLGELDEARSYYDQLAQLMMEGPRGPLQPYVELQTEAAELLSLQHSPEANLGSVEPSATLEE